MDPWSDLVNGILTSGSDEVKRWEELVRGVPADGLVGRLTIQVQRWLRELGGRLLSALLQQRIDAEGAGRRMPGVHQYRSRSWRSPVGTVTLVRGCRRDEAGTYSAAADALLGLPDSRYTLELQWLIVLLSTQGAYEREMDTLCKMLGIEVSASVAEDLVEDQGQQLVAEQRQHQQAVSQPQGDPEPEAPVERLLVGVDAATYRSREQPDEPWKEMKIGCVAALEADGKPARGKRYVAEIDKDHLGEQLYIQARHQGLGHDTQVVAVADGAAMNWNLIAEHFGQACVEILDFYHACEHLWACARALHGEGTEEAARWAHAQRHQLKRGRVGHVINTLARHIRALGRRRPADRKILRQNLNYFQTNRHRMNYPLYRARGYPIGSGFIESACKQIVTARLKGSGMRWRRDGALHMAKLKALALSSDLHTFITRQQRKSA